VFNTDIKVVNINNTL